MNNRASFIEIVTATFAAGESRLFALTGQYFEIIDATFPVDVTLSDFYGAQRGLMKAAEASFNLKNTDFGVIQITSASAQTIRFAYGTGEAGTRRAAGAVSIVGTVPVDLVAADVDLLRQPLAPTGTFNAAGAVAANTAIQIFAPGSNVNGAVILSAQISDYAAVQINGALLAKSSAPANLQDGDPVLMAGPIYSAGSNPTTVFANLTIPQWVAPGLGLYFISSLAVGPGSLRACRYRML